MENIPLPKKIEVTAGDSPNEGILTVEPCFSGYGTTIGNALRRVLLASLPGAAVTAVKIRGAQHEYSTIKNVKEDVLEILLNFKLLRLKIFTDEKVRLKLNVKGEKKVTAKDIAPDSNVEISNPELHLATLTDKSAELEIEIIVEKGRGYVPTEERTKTSDEEIGLMSIDSLFSPIKNVGLKVENVRVGQLTNFDKLTLNIETDGTITVEDAVAESSKILLDHIGLFLELEEKPKKPAKKESKSEKEDADDKAEEPEEKEEEKEEEIKEKKTKPKKESKKK